VYAEVQRVEQLSPSLVRVHLQGGTLQELETSHATDAYINAKFVPPGSPLRVPFSREGVEALPIELRPHPRRLTIRRWDEETSSLAIDVATHGVQGHASSWAQRARPGNRLQLTGPAGSYRPSAEVDWHLLAGDESTLGAIGASLQALPAAATARAFVVVDAPGHEIDLPTLAEADVQWLHRSSTSNPETLLPDAVARASFPGGSFDVFVHGEAGEVRAVRRHLIAERGIDAEAASISPYWRRGLTDEEWRRIKRQWLSEQRDDVRTPHDR
jgi:NADPH-dependent ferric siderophore reductase